MKSEMDKNALPCNIILGNFDLFVYHFIYLLSILFLYFSLFVVYIFFFLGDISLLQVTL